MPDDVDELSHWQLIDAQGNSYVKSYTSEQLVSSETIAAKHIRVLEFTGRYIPIPYSKVGQIRLLFPVAFRHLKNDKEVVVQCDTIITHHK